MTAARAMSVSSILAVVLPLPFALLMPFGSGLAFLPVARAFARAYASCKAFLPIAAVAGADSRVLQGISRLSLPSFGGSCRMPLSWRMLLRAPFP
jgi:hypothetical protein